MSRSDPPPPPRHHTLTVPPPHPHHHLHRTHEHRRDRPSVSRSTSASSLPSSAYSTHSRDHRRPHHDPPPPPRSTGYPPHTSTQPDHSPPHHTPHTRHHHHHRARRTPSPSIRSAATDADKPSSADQEGLIHVSVGDTLHHGRFKVLGFAGQGTFGTVLDVYDTKHHQRLALKVVRSVSRYLEAAAIEIDILDKIRKADTHKQSSNHTHTHTALRFPPPPPPPLLPLHPSSPLPPSPFPPSPTPPSSLCVRLYRDFELHHAGQRHVCIGTEKLGRSLYEFIKKNRYRGFTLPAVRVLGYQLMKAVAFCHSIGLIHTDLKPENILLAHSDYTTTTHMGRSDYRTPRSLEIRLIDFGGATFETEHHSRIVNTRQYRAPEVLLGLGWSYPSDMWSVGCILCELLTGELLFPTHEDLEHLAMMERVLEEEVPRDLGERAIRPWRRKRADEMERVERERERERDRSRRTSRISIRGMQRGTEERRDERNGTKRARSPPHREEGNKRRRQHADGDEGAAGHAHHTRPSSSSSTSRYRFHHPQHSPTLSASHSRDRSSSHARVNHLLSLSTARLRWPPAHSSTSSLKRVRKVATLRALLHHVDPLLYDLVRRCLQWDGARRLTAGDALQHPFFRGAKEELERMMEEERRRQGRREEGREVDGGREEERYQVRVEYAEEKGERGRGEGAHRDGKAEVHHRDRERDRDRDRDRR